MITTSNFVKPEYRLGCKINFLMRQREKVRKNIVLTRYYLNYKDIEPWKRIVLTNHIIELEGVIDTLTSEINEIRQVRYKLLNINDYDNN